MIFFRSVKFRLTLWYAFVLTVLLSIFSFLMYAELERVLYRDVDKSLRYKAVRLKSSLESYLQGISLGITIADEQRFPLYPYVFPPELRIRLRQIFNSWENRSR